MKRWFAAFAAALAALALFVVTPVQDASAHERRTVAGKYTFVVGWLNEPALLEEPNAISLAVTDAQTNEPVEGVGQTLKVDATTGGQTKSFDLSARFGQRGAYIANLIPTRAGSWVFRFYGTIEGTTIEERFESGPGRFNDVEPKSALEFPAQVPSVGELASEVRGGGQLADSTPGDAQRALDEAEDAQRTATLFGLAGIVVGLLGLAVGGFALMSRRGGAGRAAEPV